MGYGITDSKHYKNIADMIRQISGSEETWTPEEMPRAILNAAANPGEVSVWGRILGDISDQTDLQTALGNKVNISDLGDLAEKNKVSWNSDIIDIPQTFPPSEHNHDNRYYTETEVDTLLESKASVSDLGDLAEKDKVSWNSDIIDIPQTFPPSTHIHDNRYYTEEETNILLLSKVNHADLGSLARIDDAPTDEKIYGRRNGRWVETASAGSQSSSWGNITGNISNQTDLQTALNNKVDKLTLGDMANVNDAPYDGKIYGRKNGQWIEISTGGIEDAPHDNKFYVRKNGQWVEVEVK